ncbi:MAG: hypothetical protein CO163_11620 [Rhodobacterales bacterium CG_4_9_14_3_um_filter_71_31]|nr:MAG: hypothetical protein CO163_11620 [Rhodobacterales bacterium CG_4_9_14_3_um_filter_71_31]
MLKAMTVAAALALAAAGQAVAQQGAAPQEARVLSVTGTGSVSAAPDMARATFGVTAQRPEASAAFSAVAQAMTDVLAAVAAAGVAAADVQTVALSLSPVYGGGGDAPLRLEGYAARQQVAVTVRALDALGPLLDAAARAGATDFDGVGFDVADRKTLEDAALAAALADAARIAGLMAEGAGVRLGAPLSIALGGGGRPEPQYRMSAMEAAMPLAAGSISVSVSVAARYAID